MSEFKCEVVQVKIERHPNADAIEIARVGDYQSIVRKGQFVDGDLAVYIPEQALVPEWLLRQMKLWDEAKNKGGLAGSSGNRVKAIKLRGVVSQGLLLDGQQASMWFDQEECGVIVRRSVPEDTPAWKNQVFFKVGEDAASFLGIVKYEPPIPSNMRGRVVGVDLHATNKYDFDNLKKMPDLFSEDDYVVATEKIHGTHLCIGVVPSKDANEKYFAGRVTISSKGMGAKGFVLDHNDEGNLYAQACKKHDLLNKALSMLGVRADETGEPHFIMGEVFGVTHTGAGVQDLTYTGETLDYRAFDICKGNRGSEEYFSWGLVSLLCDTYDVPLVPELYVGKYSKEAVLRVTDGPTTLHNTASRHHHLAHMREGVVVKCMQDARSPRYGRKIAKSVSDAYLLRKNATEFN